MYCLAVIMCRSCTSGMWGRVPGRLVWSRRLVCVYLTAPHSCVLSKCNRRRPHPSEKGILPSPLLFSYSSSLSSPNFLFKCLHCENVSKQARGRVKGQCANRRVSPAFLPFQEGVHFSRSCLWASRPGSTHVGRSEIGLGLWQHRCSLSDSNSNLYWVNFLICHYFDTCCTAHWMLFCCYYLKVSKFSFLTQEIEHKNKHVLFKGRLVRVHNGVYTGKK